MKKENKLYAEVDSGMLGALSGLASAAILIVIVVIVMAFGADINQDVAEGLTENTTAWNTTMEGQVGLQNLSGRMGLIGTLIGVSVILTFVLGFAAFKFGSG